MSGFNIEVRFGGGLNDNQKEQFEAAAQRWGQVIAVDVPAVNTDIGVVDDLVIDASGIQIDGASGTLGQAGPKFVRPGSLIPARGIMEFDLADLGAMEQDGSLLNVIIHEMGHVVGIGTLWDKKGVLSGAGTEDPRFTGETARAEFASLKGDGIPENVPVANTGGVGTADGHWREDVFNNELMTGFLDGGSNPLSRLTLASLIDLGYEVDFNAADIYELPTELEMANALQVPRKKCLFSVPEIEILPAESKIDPQPE